VVTVVVEVVAVVVAAGIGDSGWPASAGPLRLMEIGGMIGQDQ
jgi:hypothetical protein